MRGQITQAVQFEVKIGKMNNPPLRFDQLHWLIIFPFNSKLITNTHSIIRIVDKTGKYIQFCFLFDNGLIF
jgi:hypothetical protein